MTTEELTIEVNKALENQTFLNSDGGDISLISIEMISMLKCASKELVQAAV
jgi:Fe-S cluster biogenesis protein NfuA